MPHLVKECLVTAQFLQVIFTLSAWSQGSHPSRVETKIFVFVFSRKFISAFEHKACESYENSDNFRKKKDLLNLLSFGILLISSDLIFTFTPPPHQAHNDRQPTLACLRRNWGSNRSTPVPSPPPPTRPASAQWPSTPPCGPCGKAGDQTGVTPPELEFFSWNC
jgi:hypothetical protein